MSAAPSELSAMDGDAQTAFYRSVLQSLAAANVECLVGGAFAYATYTGIERNTKDLDLFLRPGHYGHAVEALARDGFATELAYPHWLGKVRHDDGFVDLIFNSGNGTTPVDDAWFEHAIPAHVLGLYAKIVPVEEMIWSKAFIMERERYDGADVAHMLRDCAGAIDWPRLLCRFGDHWRVLLSHVVLFGFIYPGERAKIPAWLVATLLARLRDEVQAPAAIHTLCRGTLLSREQYLHDVHCQGYIDARLRPFGTMSADDLATWTDAIRE